MRKPGYYATCPRCGGQVYAENLDTEIRHECGHATQIIRLEWPCKTEVRDGGN
jgi:ribosomal protein L37E